MKPWKIALVLIALIIIALAISPLLEEPAVRENAILTPEEAAKGIRANADSRDRLYESTYEPETVADLMAHEAAAQPLITDPAVTVQLAAIESAETPDDKFIAMIELSETSGHAPQTIDFFLKALTTDDADTSMIAVECLRNIGNPAIIPELKAALHQIKNLETKEMVEELIEFLETTDSYAEATGDLPPAR